MPWAVVAAGVAAGGSYLASENASDSADARAKKIDDAAKSKEQRFQDYYSPLEKQITAEAAQGVTPDYTGRAARIHADVSAAFDKTREIGNREQSRYGIGVAQDYNKDIDIARALSEVDATNRAYLDERNRGDTLGFDRKYKTLQLGYGLPSEATGLYGQQQGYYANQAAAYGKDAAAGIGAAANLYARNQAQSGASGGTIRVGGESATSGGPGVDTSGTNLFAGDSAAYYGGSPTVDTSGTNLFASDYGGYPATTYPYTGDSGVSAFGAYAEGGPVIAGNANELLRRDAIPARLSHGEFVNDPETVAYYGIKHFADLKAKAKVGMDAIRQGAA
jgi:hypothetical protein